MSIKKLGFVTLICLSLAACKSSEERAAEHYQAGVDLLEQDDPQRAIVEFRNAIKLNEANIDARRKIAKIHMDLGNKGAAYRSYLQVVERQPKDLEGRLALSKLAFEGLNWDEFERHGTVVIELAADNPQAKAIKVGLDYRNAAIAGDSAGQSAVLVQAEALSNELPDNNILRQLRIDAYVSDEKYAEALELLSKNISENPENLNLYRGKLELLARLGDETELEETLRDMLTRFPDETSPKEMLLRYLVSRQRLDDAESFLRDLLAESGPEDRNASFFTLIQFIGQTRGGAAALQEVNTALEKEPGNDAWKVLRASLEFDAGNRDEGITALEAVLNSETPALTAEELQNAKVALAGMLLNNGNEVGARREVEEILETSPNSAPALKMQANWLIADDDTNGAITALRIALEQEPEDAAAMLLMAQAYQRAGNKELMQNFLSLAVEASNSEPRYAIAYARALIDDENYIAAETTLIASLRITPGNANVLTLLGRVYLAMDDLPRAQQVADTLENIDQPEAKNAANGLTAEILARQVGGDQAIAFLEQLAANGSGDKTVATLNLIRAQLQSGNAQEAVKLSKEAVADAPDDLRLRNALALSYSVVRDYAAAEAEFRSMLDIRPNTPQLWLQLARLKSAQADPEGAQQIINEGLEAVPGSPDLLWGKASYLQSEGDIDGAIYIYEELYKEISSSPIIANNLASLLTTYRDDDASLERARTIARRLQGTDVPAFQDTYGWILFRTGDVDEAVTYLEPAAASLLQDPSVQYHLGKAYAALGRTDEALDQMRKAVVVAGPLGNAIFLEKAQAEIDALEAATKE